MIIYYQDLKNSMIDVENSTQVKFSKVNNLVSNILSGLEKEGIIPFLYQINTLSFLKLHSFNET